MTVISYALTTVARLCAYMKISVPTGTDLTTMESMVNAVTTFIENYCGRRFKKTTYTRELYDTEDAETLNLKNFPIISTETFILERRDSSINEDDWQTIDEQYYYIDYDSGSIVSAGGLIFGRTRKGYRATYTAGYDFDNVATFLSDTEAGDVELAAWMLMASVWNSKSGGGSGNIQSESIGDYSVTYKASLMENEDVKSILDNYSSGGMSVGGGGGGVGVIGPLTPFQS